MNVNVNRSLTHHRPWGRRRGKGPAPSRASDARRSRFSGSKFLLPV